MSKIEARQKIKRLAEELAQAMTEGGEAYRVYIARPLLPSQGQDPLAYVAEVTVETTEAI